MMPSPRGLALYMILVDHVIGDPISRFTLQNFGFSVAAEAFVFLSGLSCGIVYFRILRRAAGNVWQLRLTGERRKSMSITITSIAVILILKTPKRDVTADVSHSFVVCEAPISAIWSTVLLTSPPALPGILVIYLVLTVVVHSTVSVGCRC